MKFKAYDVIIFSDKINGVNIVDSKIVGPVYQQIAVDIASKIISGHYSVGDKIYARSSLATQYNVSSETARRAISILQDMNIVDIQKGSGVIITSCDNAVKFLKQYNDITTIVELKHNILTCVERMEQENAYLKEKLIDLIDKTDRFRDTNPFMPFEIIITENTPHIEKTISEINFWHNTTATIIGIKRDNILLMSPGPYSTLKNKDILYFVGDENCISRVKAFLYPEP